MLFIKKTCVFILSLLYILANGKIFFGGKQNHYELLQKSPTDGDKKGEPYHKNDKLAEFLFLRSNSNDLLRRKLVFPEVLNVSKPAINKITVSVIPENDHVIEVESEEFHNSKNVPSSTVCTQNGTLTTTQMTTSPSRAPVTKTTTRIVYTTQEPRKGSRWNLGNIPYFIDGIQYDKTMIHKVQNAISHIEESSCIRFKLLNGTPSDTKLDYIFITNPSHVRDCVYLDLDEIQHRQIKLVLGYNCLSKSDIVRSLLRAIGMKSEVTHPKRDSYVRILWDNIQSRFQKLFRKSPSTSYQKYVEYDPHSIMHFEDVAFSTNGQPTIAAVHPGLRIKPSQVITSLDRMKIEHLIGNECKKRTAEVLRDSCKNHGLNVKNRVKPENNHNHTPKVKYIMDSNWIPLYDESSKDKSCGCGCNDPEAKKVDNIICTCPRALLQQNT